MYMYNLCMLYIFCVYMILYIYISSAQALYPPPCLLFDAFTSLWSDSSFCLDAFCARAPPCICDKRIFFVRALFVLGMSFRKSVS